MSLLLRLAGAGAVLFSGAGSWGRLYVAGQAIRLGLVFALLLDSRQLMRAASSLEKISVAKGLNRVILSVLRLAGAGLFSGANSWGRLYGVGQAISRGLVFALVLDSKQLTRAASSPENVAKGL